MSGQADNPETRPASFRGLADYAAPSELGLLPPGEPVKRCLLGPLKRFLGGLGVPTLSFEVPTGEFDASTDSFDGRGDDFEVPAAGFGFLPNGFGFPNGVSGALASGSTQHGRAHRRESRARHLLARKIGRTRDESARSADVSVALAAAYACGD